MADGKIILKVRPSNLSRKDHVVVCDPQWTIQKVKEMTQESMEGNPAVTQQKYIFGGKFLDDNTTLCSVFKVSSEPHVIHVFLGDQFVQQSTQQAATTSSQDFNSSSNTQSELRHRHTSYLPHHNYPGWTSEQTAAYHQQYQHLTIQYQQAMSQYMQYYSSMYPVAAAAAAGSEAHVDTRPPVLEQNANNNRREANPPMNAQGGFAVADDDDMQNDWLDLLFTMMRGAFFLSIIYFYSTLYRFFTVCLIFVVVYLYQAGYFAVRRRQNPPPAQASENNPPAIDDNNNEQTPPGGENDSPPSPTQRAAREVFSTSPAFNRRNIFSFVHSINNALDLTS